MLKNFCFVVAVLGLSLIAWAYLCRLIRRADEIAEHFFSTCDPARSAAAATPPHPSTGGAGDSLFPGDESWWRKPTYQQLEARTARLKTWLLAVTIAAVFGWGGFLIVVVMAK